MAEDWEKTVHCHTCRKDFHPLGIMRHRAMHRDRGEDCEITFSSGDTYSYRFATADAREVEK